MAPKRIASKQIATGSSTDRQSSPSSSEESSHAQSSSRGRKRISGAFRQLVPSQVESPTHPSQRRGSSSTMRTTSVPLEGPITYTPTTGRISKAKKGKRVHACDHPGCGKVFTRAEHRRRHELNHNPEHSFPCDRPGCGRQFHRLDLLQRHQERHDLEGSITGTPKHTNSLPVVAEPPMVTMQHSVPSTPAVAHRQPADVSISGIINHHGDIYMSAFPQVVAPISEYHRSSSESGYGSEVYSDHYQPYAKRGSISSVSSSPFHSTGFNSPMIPTTVSGPWAPMPSALFPQPSQILPPNSAESTLSIPFSKLDEREWGVICGDLSRIPRLVSRDDDGPGVLYSMRYEVLEYYWKHFHPSYPIIHKPSFFAANPAPLLLAVMVAIGSIYDTRPDAQHYSQTLLEIASRLLSSRDKLSGKSRLADLQTVLLHEIISKYRSRRAESQTSSRFRILYTLLHNARNALSQDPLSVLKGKQPGKNLAGAYESWVVQETKRRMLQACFIFDTQQHLLFGQPRTLTHHKLPRLDLSNLSAAPLFPCEDELWESSPVEKWVEKTTTSLDTEISGIGASNKKKPIDIFQSRLLLSQPSTTLEEINRLCPRPLPLPTLLTYHTLSMSRALPLTTILTVAGESWLLGRKVENEVEFTTAKHTLRTWVEMQSQSLEALWHATQLLRSLIEPEDLSTGERENLVRWRTTRMVHESWVVYLAVLVVWAHGHVAAGNAISRSNTGDEVASEARSYTSNTSSSTNSSLSLLDPHEADAELRDYLAMTDVRSWEELSGLDLKKTGGVLEVVRTRKLGNGNGGGGGGLLNESERVLFRLLEGRSRIANF